MSDYKKLVKSEAEKYFKESHAAFLDDGSNSGAKSESPNFSRWLAESGSLSSHAETITSKWSTREHQWVQSNTRNPAPQGGDPAARSFASFFNDLIHEVKKLEKKAR